MLNPFLFENTNELKARLKGRNYDENNIDKISELAQKRRMLISRSEKLKEKRNSVSKAVGALMGKAKSSPAAAKEVDQKKDEVRKVGDKIKKLDKELETIQSELNTCSLTLPNIPHESVPAGEGKMTMLS